MDRLLAAHNATRELNRTVRDHLVGVHVGLRSTAGLPDSQRKVLVEFSFNDLIASLHDQLRLIVREFAELFIDERRGFLENAERANHLTRHPVIADIEMMKRALRLSPPVAITGNLDCTHRVGFYSGFRGLFRGMLSHRRIDLATKRHKKHKRKSLD